MLSVKFSSTSQAKAQSKACINFKYYALLIYNNDVYMMRTRSRFNYAVILQYYIYIYIIYLKFLFFNVIRFISPDKYKIKIWIIQIYFIKKFIDIK
jgi:hypothetical protein